MNTWSFNWALIRYQPWTFAIHSFFTILVFGLQVAPGLIVKDVFDRISGAGGAAPAGMGYLWWPIAWFVLVELVRLALSLGSEWYGWTFRFVAAALLRRNLFASILRRSLDQALPVSPGEAVNRFHNDVGEVTDFPTWLPDQFGKWVAAAVAIAIMASINLTITLVIFLPLIGTMALTRLAWGRILHYGRASDRATDLVIGFLGETFGAVQAVKVADAEADTAAHFEQLNERRAEAGTRYELFRGLLNSLNSSMVTFGIGVMLLLAGRAISTGAFTVGDFALFVSYLWFTTQVPSELGTFFGDYKTQEVSIERMHELIRPEPPQALVEHHPVYERGRLPAVSSALPIQADRLETLEVRGLSYRYAANGNGRASGERSSAGGNGASPGQGRGIQDISLSLSRGQFLVITGRVGAGKTTLLRALLGLLTKAAGEIRWNGQPIESPAAFFRPPRCAYTPQAPRLFSETLRDNILMGLPEDQVDLPGRSGSASWNRILPCSSAGWIPWSARAASASPAARCSAPRPRAASCAPRNCWSSTTCPAPWT
jgi:ATP-binding cassette subfamily B protein